MRTIRDMLKTEEWRAEKKKKIVDNYITFAGHTKTLVEHAGIPRHHYYRWIREDPEFRAAIEEKEARLLDIMEARYEGLLDPVRH